MRQVHPTHHPTRNIHELKSKTHKEGIYIPSSICQSDLHTRSRLRLIHLKSSINTIRRPLWPNTWAGSTCCATPGERSRHTRRARFTNAREGRNRRTESVAWSLEGARAAGFRRWRGGVRFGEASDDAKFYRLTGRDVENVWGRPSDIIIPSVWDEKKNWNSTYPELISSRICSFAGSP